MTIPADIAAITSTIKSPAAETLAKIWALSREHREERLAAGETICPRCKSWLQPGQTCSCAPTKGAAQQPVQERIDTLQKLAVAITTGLERNPCITLRQVQRKLPNATWADFSAARTALVERYRREAWAIMDALRPGQPLPASLRILCERIVATSSGIAFSECCEYVVRKALKPKLADAFMTNRACPWQTAAPMGDLRPKSSLEVTPE